MSTPAYLASPTVVYQEPTTVIQEETFIQQPIIYQGENTEPTVQQAVPVPAEQGAGVVMPDIDGGQGLGSQLSAEQMHLLMLEGTKAFSQGQYERSADLFLQVSMQAPENVDAALAYAVARFATGDYSMAAIGIRRGVRAMPEVVNAPFDIRDRYGIADDFEKHYQQLEQHLSKHPENLDAVLVLGFVQHFTMQREWAEETFEWIEENVPADEELAETFLEAKPLEEVLEELEESQQDVPPTQPTE